MIEKQARWPALLALLAVGGLHYALPENLSVGPDWLVLAVVAGFSIPLIVSHRRGLDLWNQIFAFSALGVVTLALAASLVLLLTRLPAHKETPIQLLQGASAIWISNVLVFASWYWRLDAGGPRARALRESHTVGAFLFPQMVVTPEILAERGEENWSPGFVDYLFLAFNTSTAFSPTDVPVMSRWAKCLMMLQSVLSLATLAVLAARAINIL